MAESADKNVPSTSFEDFRVNCTSKERLNDILKVVEKHVKTLANTVQVEDKKAFVERFMKLYTSTLQENVTVNELPWVPDKQLLSSSLLVEHNSNVDEVMKSKLCKAISNTGWKRKYCPKQCTKVLDLKYEHDLENLKSLKVNHLTRLTPPVAEEYKPSTAENLQKFTENMIYVKNTLPRLLEETKEKVADYNMASSICNLQQNDKKKTPTTKQLKSKTKNVKKKRKTC